MQLPESKEQPWLRTAQRSSLKRFINHLKEEVEEYEALKSGNVKLPSLNGIAMLHELLIKKRIALGWTVRQLAKKVNLSYEEIENYEKSEYANATLETLQKIASALEQKIPNRSPRKIAALRLKK